MSDMFLLKISEHQVTGFNADIKTIKTHKIEVFLYDVLTMNTITKLENLLIIYVQKYHFNLYK